MLSLKKKYQCLIKLISQCCRLWIEDCNLALLPSLSCLDCVKIFKSDSPVITELINKAEFLKLEVSNSRVFLKHRILYNINLLIEQCGNVRRIIKLIEFCKRKSRLRLKQLANDFKIELIKLQEIVR